ncbi:TAXI family TRAP transporter solute-binding subunit [Microbacterium sp. ARD32]|uniref:TAXI family TRAP transporter solute-binding subunit n=1 Tax=Microbacterium sp. ARD32 TaxID=2962577 RepID=UPI0028827AA5|nr:TAXI family TRAP transporter solute-binding subunit [Microbacterium sp. ARD32]MDT0158596.1 TAXI family TRAP transporter solute-binding subunit [Microbacterium sp. ARD32]
MSARKRWMPVLIAAVMLLSLAGCAPAQPAWAQHPLRIAGGGATGVYYDYGEHLAAVLRRDRGADVQVIETNGSVDNLRLIGEGRAQLGFAQSDAVADAVAGSGDFDAPLPIRTAARLYDEYVHVVVRADSGIRSIADLAGRTISLGGTGSGVSVVARRVLEASSVAADEVHDAGLGLGASIAALTDSRVDAFFWVGGLPTPGIEKLAGQLPIRLLSIGAEVVERADAAHDGVYRSAEFPVGTYGSRASTVAMTVPNYLVTSADVPDALVHDVLAELFASRGEIAHDVPAAAMLDRRLAIFTDPVALHPGAREYYRDARR